MNTEKLKWMKFLDEVFEVNVSRHEFWLGFGLGD